MLELFLYPCLRISGQMERRNCTKIKRRFWTKRIKDVGIDGTQARVLYLPDISFLCTFAFDVEPFSCCTSKHHIFDRFIRSWTPHCKHISFIKQTCKWRQGQIFIHVGNPTLEIATKSFGKMSWYWWLVKNGKQSPAYHLPTSLATSLKNLSICHRGSQR